MKAFPVLTLTTTGALTPGETITLTYPNQTTGYAIFLSALGQTVVEYPASGEVAIPEGLYGQTCAFPFFPTNSFLLGHVADFALSFLHLPDVVISSANANVTDDATLAGPAIVEVGIQATTFSY